MPDVPTIFAEALNRTGAERTAYLDAACAGDSRLRAEVDALITAHEGAGDFLDQPLVTGPAAHATISDAAVLAEQAGSIIGRYKLLQPIGEGGFGVVYMAEQKEPVKRRVALKIIKLGMDTRQVIARFEAERQALAMMDHPNIARVLDAGATDTGRPYFVMEYIRGVPILEYCDTEKLDTKRRLCLFMDVCRAIQHAHQKGIIHRDIKPSNVLITLHDGVPVPKVIDFGIAKATSSELTQKTLFTEHRQMIGTPAYMSPEQAEMSGLDIDTRSDVYSLGVLLYELLTGTTPFDSDSLIEAGFAEMMRIIREEEPHKPSTRLSSLVDTATRTAEQRRAEVSKLSSILRGDLDWIVMKCLEKDRTRRYETATGLAADIRRHLEDEPVAAGPPSTSYRLRKFIKRNRSQVIGASALVAVLVLGVAGTTWGMLWALNEKRRADSEAFNATLAATAEREAKQLAQARTEEVMMERDRAMQAEKLAQREAGRANEVKRLITEMLASLDPVEALGADTTLLKSILDKAAQRLIAGEIADERIAAELHHLVGTVFHRIGLYNEGEQHLSQSVEIRTRVLSESDPLTLESVHNLTLLYTDQALFDKAEPLLQRLVETRRRVLGETHPSTLASMGNLAMLVMQRGDWSRAEPLFHEVIEISRRERGDEDYNTLSMLANLAALYFYQSQYPEAETIWLEILDVRRRVSGESHPETLNVMNNLATLYLYTGRVSDAEPLYRETLEIRRRVFGDEHPQTLEGMSALASAWQHQRRFAEAETLFLEVLEHERRVLGAEHPETLDTQTNLASSYLDQGRLDEAESLLSPGLAARRRLMGDHDPRTLVDLGVLGAIYLKQGRLDEAEQACVEALEGSRRVLGDENSVTVTISGNLALVLHKQARHVEAEPLFHSALEAQRQVLGAAHPTTLGTMSNIGDLYNTLDRHEEAAAICQTSLPLMRQALGVQHPTTIDTMGHLALAYLRLGRRNDALPLYREQLEIKAAQADRPGADAKALHHAARLLLTLDLEELRNPERARAWAKQACTLEEETGGSSLWMYLDTLARAEHLAGDTAAAVETQKRAVELEPDNPGLAATLASYEAALGERSGDADG